VCGIVGILGQTPVAERIVFALRRLEYRGYDSAGIATLEGNEIACLRAVGKLHNLEARLREVSLRGALGIGHTRWATHGRPTEVNAHPHATQQLAVVHNGIIENYRELKAQLSEQGVSFATETDTEVVAMLATHALRSGKGPAEAVAATLARLRGAFALAFLFAGRTDLLIVARQGAPLAIGYGQGEMYVGSDAIALTALTDEILYLDDGDWAVLTREGADVRDGRSRSVHRVRQKISRDQSVLSKGGHQHFMMKEIHEQPLVIRNTIDQYIDRATGSVRLPFALPCDLQSLSKITICGCGSAYLAGCVARYWFEELADLPVEIDVASEFRYRHVRFEPHGLAIFISQSGETADTLASLRHAKCHGQHVLSIVNVPTSAIARESSFVAPTLAGAEIGVASTKTFTCQLVVLLCLAIAAGRARGALAEDRERRIIAALMSVPTLLTAALKDQREIDRIAHEISKASHVLYVGRGTSFPLSLEGALKLKEITYIPAEGFAAGELKHGPIALIDDKVPVIVVAPPSHVFDKLASNVQEIAARGGKIILIGDKSALHELAIDLFAALVMPTVDPLIAPVVYAVPMQVLAYRVALRMGRDVDKPRNLAKSVTVE
jgi:glucosamine--fructose-6-phosphate aminotransferase (isomerizing)